MSGLGIFEFIDEYKHGLEHLFIHGFCNDDLSRN